MESRINIFKQIRAFYSKVFESENNFTTTHVSLYMFLLNQNNRSNWIEWFKCPADTAMYGALISSNKTYYKTLNNLVDFKLIEVKKGINNFKAPLIKIVPLNNDSMELSQPEINNSSVIITPLLTQLTTQASTQLTTQLTTHKDILEDLNKGIPYTIIFEFKKNEKENWRKNFEIYKNELRVAYLEILKDSNFFKEQQKYYPNLDLKLTLEKSVVNYWATEAGWQNKKTLKTKNIDWKQTFVNVFSNKMNHVYKNQSETEKSFYKTLE